MTECGIGQHFQVRGRSFFSTIGTNPKPPNNLLIFFSCDKFAYNWVYTTVFIELVYVPPTNHRKNLTNERESKLRHYAKKDVRITEQIHFECFMLVASNSLVKFSKSVFLIVKFSRKV